MAGTLFEVLMPLYDVESDHLVFDLFLKFLKVNDELIAILIECRSVFPCYETVHLKLLVYHIFNLLHSLEDEEPGLDVEDVAQAVCDVEKSLADRNVSLSDCELVFGGICHCRLYVDSC